METTPLVRCEKCGMDNLLRGLNHGGQVVLLDRNPQTYVVTHQDGNTVYVARSRAYVEHTYFCQGAVK